MFEKYRYPEVRLQEVSEGSEDEESQNESEGSEDEEEDDDEQPRRPMKRQKAELPPPGREMPQRATRGQRMGALVKVRKHLVSLLVRYCIEDDCNARISCFGALQDAEEDQADEEFWNQDFFREEEEDEIYATESEPEDVADADFSESVCTLNKL